MNPSHFAVFNQYISTLLDMISNYQMFCMGKSGSIVLCTQATFRSYRVTKHSSYGKIGDDATDDTN